MKLKTTLMIALAATCMPLAACSKSAPETTAPKMSDAATPAAMVKANAVLIYADWCSSCKVLDPKVQAAMPAFKGKGLNFVKLDYTDKDRGNFDAQANAAGVAPAIAKALGENVKTGQLILVSADGERVLGKVNMNHTPAEIAKKFTSAIAKG